LIHEAELKAYAEEVGIDNLLGGGVGWNTELDSTTSVDRNRGEQEISKQDGRKSDNHGG
jgi:hypothetical protein